MGLSQFTGVVREATCAKSPGGVRQSKDSNPIFLSSQCSVSTPGFLSPLKEAPVPQSSVLPTLSCPAPTISHPPPQAPPHSFCGGGAREGKGSCASSLVPGGPCLQQIPCTASPEMPTSVGLAWPLQTGDQNICHSWGLIHFFLLCFLPKIFIMPYCT